MTAPVRRRAHRHAHLHARRALVLAVAAILALFVAAPPASAVFPHFKDADATLVFPHSGTSSVSSTSAAATGHAATTGSPAELPDLVFSFTLVGLGSTEAVVAGSVDAATATFGCVNNGSNRPKASNKTQVTLPLSGEATFVVSQNGRVTGTLPLDTAALGDTPLECPAGQTLTALQLTLAGLHLVETTSGAEATGLPDPLSMTLWP